MRRPKHVRDTHKHREKLQGYGREYWSRRYPGWPLCWGPYGKKLTHRLERRESKRVERRAVSAQG